MLIANALVFETLPAGLTGVDAIFAETTAYLSVVPVVPAVAT